CAKSFMMNLQTKKKGPRRGPQSFRNPLLLLAGLDLRGASSAVAFGSDGLGHRLAGIDAGIDRALERAAHRRVTVLHVLSAEVSCHNGFSCLRAGLHCKGTG